MYLSEIMEQVIDGETARSWWDTNYTRLSRMPEYESTKCDTYASGWNELEDGGWCLATQIMVQFGGWLENDSWIEDAPKVKHRTKAWVMK